MSKNEFLNQLAALLSDISPGERTEALEYYREYIEDAGLENEDAILDELGSPAKVAADIKSGLSTRYNPNLDYQKMKSSNQPVPAGPNPQQNHQQSSTGYTANNTTPPNNNTTVTALTIIALVFLSPIWIPVLFSIAGTLFGFVMTLFALVLGFGTAGILCIILGIFFIGLGIVKLFANLLIGFTLIGAGFIVTALGILFLLLTIWLCGTAIPWVVKGIVKLCRMPFQKKQKEASL